MKIDELKLSCGENAFQTAEIEANDKTIDYEISANMTYTEMLAVAKGLDVMSEFYDVKAACTIRGTGICAVALAPELPSAVQKVMDSNPIDFMSSVVVVSAEVDSEIARFLKDSNIIVAPAFTQNALEVLDARNVRYVTVKTPLKDYKKYLSNDVKVTPLGTLTQAPNVSELDKETFKIMSKQKPTVEQIEDAIFAWKVAKHNNSQSLVVAKDLKTTAIAQGLQAASVEFALDYSCDMSKDAVLASDMPITVHDVNVASQGRIGLIIVPFAQKDVIDQADKYSMSLIVTGFTNILY